MTIVLTQKEVEQKCLETTGHNRKHISSFSNRIMVCEHCGTFLDRYPVKTK